MIKIGFLIMNFSNGGGTERVTSIIANKLDKKKFECSIISCNNGLDPKFIIDGDIKLYSLKGEKYSNSFIRKIHNYIELKKLYKNKKYDILVSVDTALFLYLIPFKILKKCKCISWEHFNYYTHHNMFSKISRKLSVKLSDKMIVLSKNDRNNYLSNHPKAKNVEYIYNPLTMDTNKKSNLKNKRIIAVGRLEEQKGFDYLITIWSILEKKYPDWKLDIYGNGSKKDELVEQIKNLNLTNVRINNFTENIQKEFLDSSIFVLTSRYEGFGLVLLEAQSCGLPCVSFNCKEGPAEIIDDGVNGYLIECFDVKMFASKLEKLMQDKKLLLNFSKNAKKDLDRFKIENVINEWENMLYNITLGGKK